MKIRSNSGFTLVEILIAIALGLVILAGLFQTFRTQHDTYIVQDQMAAMQQNLRAAMYLITRDLQMAGWYTNFDRENRTIDLDEDDLGEITGNPLLFAARNNYDAGDGIMRDGTDALVILKAAEGTAGTITGYIPEGTGDFSGSLSGFDAGNAYGLLVKNDLRTADFFKVSSPDLNSDYSPGDMVFRADIIVYKIEDEDGRPMLKRRNLGNDNGYQIVAENVENFQVNYQLNDGNWRSTLLANEQRLVRAVEVILVGRTAHLQRGYTDTNTYNFTNDPSADYTPSGDDARYRRKVFSTTVKTRNVGLSS